MSSVPVISTGPSVSNCTSTVIGVWSSSGLTVSAIDLVLTSLTWTPIPNTVVHQPSSETECEYVVGIAHPGSSGWPSGTGGSFLMVCRSEYDGGFWSPKSCELNSLICTNGSGDPTTCRLLNSSFSFWARNASDTSFEIG